MDIFDRVFNARLSENGASWPNDDQARKDYPNLWEFLTRVEAEGGRLKEPARVSISLGLGCWSVQLSDAALGVGLSATSQTLLEAFDSLEKAIVNPGAAWQVWKGKEPILKERKSKKGGP